MLAKIYASLVLAVLAVGAMSPHGSQIVLPPKGSVIAPNTDFEFQFHSIADYGISSYNFTCWLFTSPPRFFESSDTFAVGHYLGRFSLSNYPANTYPANPPPATFRMPDFSNLGPGWGVGSNASHAKIYFAVIEEYGHGKPSLGYRMSLSVNEIVYNGSTHLQVEGQ